jgi:tRNA1Val (adenine37-N6)-methyltransferase
MVLDASYTLDGVPSHDFDLYQPADGYRFNVDSLHLIEFVASFGTVDRSCDLGAGSGLLGLALLRRGITRHATLVENNPEMLKALRANVARLAEGAADVVAADVNALRSAFEPREPTSSFARGSYRLVVSNPPYFAGIRAPATARVTANAKIDVIARGSRELARHGSLAPFLSAAAELMGSRARLCLIYPVETLTEVFLEFQRLHLHAKAMQFVHAHKDATARVVMVMAQRAKPNGLRILPPRFDHVV